MIIDELFVSLHGLNINKENHIIQ